MKYCVFLVCGLACFQIAICQQRIGVTTDLTSSLIFPFPILHIDRGTKDILVQDIKESDRILFVKAGCRNFHQTNLSVITGDGSIYSFLVSYDSLPVTLIHKIAVQVKASIETYANSILDNPSFIRRVTDHSWGVAIGVSGIYIKDEVIYLQMQFTNDSPIDYPIDYTRFYIRDQARSKRTASQEIEVKPLFIAGNQQIVKAGTSNVIVIAVDRFTIPDQKQFIIETAEKNGGRNLHLRVRNKDLLKAVMLPDLH